MPRLSNETQSLLTGMLLGQMIMWESEYRQGKGILKITKVWPDMDDQGNYLNTINVELESGTVLQVRVDELTDIHEEP